MLFSLLATGNIQQIVTELLLTLPVIVLALSIHEAAHGYVAYKCGDPTAYHMGRLTLNPLKHLDLFGFLSMLIFGFGWAKPVPINTRNFRNPKRGMALSAAAGPAANLLLGVISAFLLGFFAALSNYVALEFGQGFLFTALKYVCTLCSLSTIYNFLLMAFNLIPIPPFDGSRIAFVFLPQKYYFGIMRYERQIMFGLLIALLVIDRFTNFSPFVWIAQQLANLIYIPSYDLFNKLLLPKEIYQLFFS
ncbi:MAG: site-2 protease family protein [Clostridia bacterium]|nr:site-2 protease family protein [Clostridia bacterium]